MGELRGNASDRVGGNAAAFGDRIWRIALVQVAVGDELEDRHAAAAVDREVAGQRRLCIGIGGVDGRLRHPVPGQWIAVTVACEQPVIGSARLLNDQDMGVGVTQ
jgi:hypothetical protein